MNEDKNAYTQIVNNFGPVNGHIGEQVVYTGRDARPCDSTPTNEPTEDDSSGDKLSIRQLVLLFSEMLGVTLDAASVNQSALAKLIARVSGYAEKAVRTKITQGLDYDAKQTRGDARLVASLLKEICPELAMKIRNNATE